MNDQLETPGLPVTSSLLNTAKEQCSRMLVWLQQGPLTTLQARSELGIVHPSARVSELRKQGYWIEKITVVEVAEGCPARRVAQYKLVPEGARMPPSLVVRMLRRPPGKAAP